MSARVLKAHRQALRDAMPAAKALLADGDTDGFLDTLASAVLDAPDKTRYVVGVRCPSGATYIYGPYPSVRSASKAAAGFAAVHEGQQAGVFPMIKNGERA